MEVIVKLEQVSLFWTTLYIYTVGN